MLVPTIAALYVQPRGVYYDLAGVEPWGMPDRDAQVVDTRDAVEALTLAVALARQGQGSEDDVDKELVQVAAVIVQWIEARAVRRALAAGPRTTVDDTALAHGWDADGREVR